MTTLDDVAMHFPESVARELLDIPRGSVVALESLEINDDLAICYSSRLIDYLGDDYETERFLNWQHDLVSGKESIEELKRRDIGYREKVWNLDTESTAIKVLGFIRFPYEYMSTHPEADRKDPELLKVLAEEVRKDIRKFVTPI